MKIQICGFSGSGKSTFAKRLSQIYELEILYIDTKKFGPNWIEYSHEKIENDILNFMDSHQNWVIDGNYFLDATVRFDDCDIIFLFKFNRFKCLYGAIRRYFKYRGKPRESLGNHLDEKLDWSFIKWILYEGRIAPHITRMKNIQEKYKNKVIVFKRRRQVNKYLRKIGFTEPIKYE